MMDTAATTASGACLLGRTEEFVTITRLVEAARGGNGGAVVVRGQEGIGLTSLLDAVTRAVSETGVTVLWATCREPDVQFGVARRLFAPFAPHLTDSELLSGDAKWALPALLGTEVPRGDSAHVLLRGLYWLTVNLAAEGPLLIVVDDSHRCDVATLAWLDFLVRRVASLPVLVVLGHSTWAAGFGEVALSETLVHEGSHTVELGPLPPDVVAELVARELGEPPALAFVEACVEVSGGNPMLLDRLLGELRANDAVPTHEAAAQVKRLGAVVLAAPALERLRDQPDFVRDVARAIALLGSVDAGTVGALFGLSAQVVATGVEALCRAEVLTPCGHGFRNDQVRQAVLDELSAEELSALNLRAARLLSDEGRPSEEIAPLVMALPALPEVWMFCALRDAAQRAASAGAPEVAIRYLRRVIEAVPGHQATLLELVDVLAVKDPSSAMDQLLEVIDQTADPRTTAALVVRLGVLSSAAHRQAEALPRLLDALGVLAAEVGALPTEADRDLLVLVRSTSVMVGLQHGSTMRWTLEWARDLPVPDVDTTTDRMLVRNLAWVRALRGDSAKEAARLARAGLGEQPPLDDPTVLSAVMVLHYAGESDAALGHLDALVAATRQRGDAVSHSVALNARGRVLAARGNLADAAADVEIALAIATGEGASKVASWPRITLAAVLTQQAEPERAEVLLSEVDDPAYGPEYCQYLMVRAGTCRAVGDPEQALALYRRCQEALDEFGERNPIMAPWWLGASGVLAELGRSREALDVVDLGEELAGRWGTAESVGLAMLARGLVTPGQHGVDLLGNAVNELAASPARLNHIRAVFLHSRALLALDDEKGARKHLRLAVTLAMSHGYLAVGRAARELLVAAGGRMRELSGQPTELLTGSECRVAAMAAAGHTNREIAEALFVTMRTVESHLSNVYRKLRVGVRADLATALRRETGSVSAEDRRSGMS